MFITTHAALGALVGQQFANSPFLAFIFGMMSHFLSDIIPHGDSKLYKNYIAGNKRKQSVAYVVVDSVAAICFVLVLFNTQYYQNRLAISMGIFGGVLPDALVGIYEMWRVPGFRWFHRVHFFFHNMISSKKGDMSFRHGLAMQAVLLAILISKVM